MCFFLSVPGVLGMPSVHSVLGGSLVPCVPWVPCVPSVLAFIFRAMHIYTYNASANTFAGAHTYVFVSCAWCA